MNKILMTGGAGFIGSHTAEALLARGHRVRVLDLLDPQIHGKSGRFPAWTDPRVERMKGDVRRPKDLARALDGIDTIYHFAARTGVGQSMYNIRGYVDVNVGGTAALLQAVVRRKQPIKRLVLASSRAVYGEGLSRCFRHGLVSPPARLREDLEKGDFGIKCEVCGGKTHPVSTPENARTNPLSFYALTKKHQEDLCLQTVSAYGIPVVILRYFNVYGSRQALGNPYTGVVTVFFNRLREGKPISLYEAGLPTRDFVHVSDVVVANVAALDPRLPTGSIFNVGSGQGITIRQLAVTLGRQMGRRPLLEDKGEFRVGDILACTADLSRSAAVLRYRSRMSLQRGLKEFLRWAWKEKRAQGGYERTVRELAKKKLFGRADLG